MKKITLITLVSLAALYSCSKEDSCSFTKSTFENKTYKLVQRVDSNGIDVTNRWVSQQDPCTKTERERYTFNNDGTYRNFQTPTTMVGCTTRNYTGMWDVKIVNGKNIFKIDASETIIDAFDCNSFTIVNIDTLGQSILKVVSKLEKI
jgi:hypothetical protein